MIAKKLFFFSFLVMSLIGIQSCQNNPPAGEADNDTYRLAMLAPGHFHAALLQKSMYPEIDSTVDVYAPDGPELNTYLDFISGYNSRSDNPTHWNEEVYTGQDYLEKMLATEKPGRTIVAISGNNQRKTEYITSSVNAGLHVLADKPMVISTENFTQLKKAFETAREKKVVLYDIMTERYAAINIIQKALRYMPDVFGELENGTPDNPAVILKSLHHYYKTVSGKTLRRPAWFFDVNQQGGGLLDITTHFIDIIQWACFSETVFDYEKDVQILSAKQWPTTLTLEQFKKVTGVDQYPDYLKKDVKGDQLNIYGNGEMHYTLKGVNAEVGVEWRYVAPEGTGDTYFSQIRGTKATLTIRQDKEQNYKPTLYIKPADRNDKSWKAALEKGLEKITQQFEGVTVAETGDELEVVIPAQFVTGEEPRFAAVIKKYLQFLKSGNIPDWEESFMLTKYYTTTRALEVASGK